MIFYSVRFLLLPIFLVLFVRINAQNDKVKAIFMEAFKELSIQELPKKGHNFYLKYSARVVFVDPLQMPLETNVEYIISSTGVKLISDKVQFFQDEKEAFSIIAEDKVIVRMDANREVWKNSGQLSSILTKKDFIFNSADYKLIKEENGLTMVKITPSVEFQKDLRVQYLIVELDTTNKKVKRMAIFHSDGERKITEYIYYVIDYDSKLQPELYAWKQVLDNKGRLLPIYKAYRYLDVRKPSVN